MKKIMFNLIYSKTSSAAVFNSLMLKSFIDGNFGCRPNKVKGTKNTTIYRTSGRN